MSVLHPSSLYLLDNQPALTPLLRSQQLPLMPALRLYLQPITANPFWMNIWQQVWRKGTLLLCLLLLWTVSCSLAHAAPTSASLHLTIADIVYLYEQEILQLKDNVVFYATMLLYSLSGFAIVLTGINMIFLHQGSIQSFALSMVRLCLIIGIFKFFIINGYDISRDIMASLTDMAYGGQSHSGYQDILSILRDFFLLAEEYVKTLSTRNIFFFLFFMVPFFVIIVLIIINFVLNYIIALFVSVMGVLVVALGALPFTRGFALNYLHMVIAYGLRLFSLCFLYRIGQNVIADMIAHLRYILEQGEMITMQDAGLVLFVLSFILFLSYTMPSIISRLIQPTQINSLVNPQAK